MAKSMRTTNRELSERSVRRFAQMSGEALPRTPVPLRASAYPVDAVRVRARFPRIAVDEDEADIAHLPTRPEFVRQQAEIEKILFMPSSLALPVSPLPEVFIEDINTQPPLLSASGEEARLDVSDLATAPPRSAEDEEIAYVLSVRLLDRLRWWLLHPGRLEMIVWVIGVLLLISVTGFFMFIFALSLGGSMKVLP